MMNNNNFLNINVELAGRSYPVLVTEDELNDVKQINQQLQKEFIELQTRYASKLNKQDILAMLLFNYAQELHSAKQQNDLSSIEEKVMSIENSLEKAFEKA